jgi:hypothetical protein
VKIAAMQWFDRALYQLGEMVRNETDSGKLADGGQHTRIGPELGNQLGAAIPTSVSQTSTSLSKNSSSIE